MWLKCANEVTEISNPDFEAWYPTDQLIKSWIFSTLSESVLGYVYGLDSAQDVWLSLAEIFSHCSISREFDLLSSLQLISAGNQDLPIYICVSLNQYVIVLAPSVDRSLSQ